MSSPARLEIVAHERARRHAASDRLETGARARRRSPRNDVGRALRCVGIHRLGFQRRGPGALGGFHRRSDQRRHDAPSAVALAPIKAGQRPDRHRIHALEQPRAIQPRQSVAWWKLAPPHGPVTVEGEQALEAAHASRDFEGRPCFARAASGGPQGRGAHIGTNSRCGRRPCRTGLRALAIDQVSVGEQQAAGHFPCGA
jgi:hypothetical protein